MYVDHYILTIPASSSVCIHLDSKEAKGREAYAVRRAWHLMRIWAINSPSGKRSPFAIDRIGMRPKYKTQRPNAERLTTLWPTDLWHVNREGRGLH